ncbi:MAG TPA: AraC family transcriptional regulator [Candidatus Eisenbergiella merdipullorum]|uniref:AraC family transcriptional regulator n=1 Tax=Candidatus Eisenbergiella merdipullorum TaxID=2838553 RepID=A0A9D2I9I0_9FIRM|nr:AraC family transcriptional regulator [Candidatus Eisenbergiella merdipullorum]
MKHTEYAPYAGFGVEYVCNPQKSDMKMQHYHDSYELYLQIAGERTLLLNDLLYTLRPGDLYFLKPFELHYTKSYESSYYERYLMNIPASCLSPILTEPEAAALFGSLDSCVLHLDEEQAVSALNAFRRAEYYGRRKGFLSDKLLCSVVLQLLIFISELLSRKEISEGLSAERIPDEIVSAIRYINRHYSEPVSLEKAASRAHMSRYHFCRVFHGATGATFLEYLYNVRLSKAHQLLLDSELPLNEIASRCGFSSTAHLTRIFKNKYGMPPREFRKRAEH